MDPFLPYFAGFFDGEGSIGIYTNRSPHRGRTLRVQLTQNITPISTELLQECQQRWGGALTVMNRQYRRQAWCWQASARTGLLVLKDIRPWLRIKAEEADVVIQFWRERGFAQRGPNGRFLPMDAETRRACELAEATLKAIKRGERADASSMDSVVIRLDHVVQPRDH